MPDESNEFIIVLMTILSFPPDLLRNASGIDSSAAAQLVKAQKTISELTASREVLAEKLASKEASYQVLLSDTEVRRAPANSDPIQLLGHQHNYLPADVERLACLERDLRSAQEDAAASKEQAERALSSMFVRLAKDRATHERERQQLQHRLLQASQELLHRRAHDKLRLDQAGKVRELWRDVMSVASLHPGSGDEHRDQNNGNTSGASLKVNAALLRLQGPLLDLLDEVGGANHHPPAGSVAEQGQGGPLRHTGGRASLPSAVQQGALEWALDSEDDGLAGLRQRLAQLRHAIRGDSQAGLAVGVGGDGNSPSRNKSSRRPLTWGSAGGGALKDGSDSERIGHEDADVCARNVKGMIGTAAARGGELEEEVQAERPGIDAAGTAGSAVGAMSAVCEGSSGRKGMKKQDKTGGQGDSETDSSALAAVALLQVTRNPKPEKLQVLCHREHQMTCTASCVHMWCGAVVENVRPRFGKDANCLLFRNSRHFRTSRSVLV